MAQGLERLFYTRNPTRTFVPTAEKGRARGRGTVFLEMGLRRTRTTRGGAGAARVRREAKPELTERAQRDEAVLQAAVRLLGKGGLSAVTHRSVAQEAGLSLGSVTYRHPTVERLLEDALRWLCASEVQALEALAARLEARGFDADTWSEAFAAALAERVRAGSEGELAGYEALLAGARRPGLRRALREMHAAYVRIAARALAAAGSRRAEALAPVLNAAVLGLELTELSDPQPHFQKRLAASLRALVLGLVATEVSHP